jgi:hypothetical protein
MPFTDFVDLQAFFAADVDLLMRQSIMRFASAAARDSALAGVLAEGMFAYLDDVDSLTIYSGAAWISFGPVTGAPTTFTPTLTQSGAVTSSSALGRYWIFGKLAVVKTHNVASSAGTGGNDIVIGGIPTAVAPAYSQSTFGAGTAEAATGSGHILDSGSAGYPCTVFPASSTTLKLISDAGTTGSNAGSNPNFALASGDVVRASILYPIA